MKKIKTKFVLIGVFLFIVINFFIGCGSSNGNGGVATTSSPLIKAVNISNKTINSFSIYISIENIGTDSPYIQCATDTISSSSIKINLNKIQNDSYTLTLYNLIPGAQYNYKITATNNIDTSGSITLLQLDTNTQNALNLFNSGDSNCINSFANAIIAANSLNEKAVAITGYGFAVMTFNQDTNTAITYFDSAIVQDSNNLDAYAGKAGALLSIGSTSTDFQNIIYACDSILNKSDTTYQSIFSGSINYVDIYALKGAGYFYLGGNINCNSSRIWIDKALKIESTNDLAKSIDTLLKDLGY